MYAQHTLGAETSMSVDLLDHYSLEMTIKDVHTLAQAAHLIAPGTSVSIAFLPREKLEDRIAVARLVRTLGFEPKVHLPARRITSQGQLGELLEGLALEAGLKQVLVIAGDSEQPAGPFPHALSVIETGLLEASGITNVAIGGHPEGLPTMDAATCQNWLERKIDAIGARGMTPHIVTQFAFDADALLDWLAAVRLRAVNVPVALGVPGPAGAKRLLAFAARCGVGASTKVLKKYGLSLTSLMRPTGPDHLLDDLNMALDPVRHGSVSLHFYPFGGLETTAEWIAARHGGRDRAR